MDSRLIFPASTRTASLGLRLLLTLVLMLGPFLSVKGMSMEPADDAARDLGVASLPCHALSDAVAVADPNQIMQQNCCADGACYCELGSPQPGTVQLALATTTFPRSAFMRAERLADLPPGFSHLPYRPPNS